jgi:hypothetical protein
MVDTPDSKSCELNARVGSSPTSPTKAKGLLAGPFALPTRLLTRHKRFARLRLMKKTQKRSNFHPSLKKLFLIGGASLAVILLIGQLTFDFLAMRHMNSSDETQIVLLIIAAVENLSKPAAVDARTGDMYIPEVKLRIPAQSDGWTLLRYSYSPQVDSQPTELLVSDQRAVRAAESRLLSLQSTESAWWQHNTPSKVFDEVPNLQACARGIHVRFSSGHAEGLQLEANLPLQDGRTAYLFSEDGVACNSGANNDQVLALLKQVKSY